MIVKTSRFNYAGVLLTVVLTLFFGQQGHASPPQRMQYLLYLFDMNEAAFAYHRHCINPEEKLNSNFLRGLELIADELFQSVQENEPKMSPEFIKSRIQERKYSIQYSFDRTHIQGGCSSREYAKAKEHYQMLSELTVSEIRKIISRETKSN